MDVVIINLDTNNRLEFDNNNFILNQIVHDNCVVQHNTSKTIKQIGEYVKSTNVNSRTINIIGYAIGQSAIDLSNKKQKLLNITSPLSNVKVIVNNKYQITGKCDGIVKWAVGHENNNEQFVKFSIDILAPNTLWYDIEPTRVSLSPYINTFKFPISIPESGFSYGHKDDNLLTNIYNQCNVPLALKFTLTSLVSIKNPVITRIQDNKKIKLNLTLNPGDTVIVNTEFGSKTVTLNGENIISKFDFNESTWLMLQPGLNTFSYSCENIENRDSFNIDVEYNQGYWGIY